MVKIAGVKSNDKINFKEFVDFFYKIDWIKVDEIEKWVKLIMTEWAIEICFLK